jgi:ABC-type methionine transport system ATPase subunit
VTHQVHFLSKADQIVYLENGKTTFQGSFGDLFSPKTIDLDNILVKNTSCVDNDSNANETASLIEKNDIFKQDSTLIETKHNSPFAASSNSLDVNKYFSKFF